VNSSSLTSWQSFRNVRRVSKSWGDRPTGLGYFDIAAYLTLTQVFEQVHKNQRGEYWLLDLGTYFGHSAFTFLFGSCVASSQSRLRVLSIDLFDQPAWLHTTEPVKSFVRQYGSTGPTAVRNALVDALVASRLPAAAVDRIMFLQLDVTLVKAEQLLAPVPQGFVCFAVDCGKFPSVMNSIMQLVTDPRVAPKGSLLLFQDLLDWHAPWNLYAFWSLLASGNGRIKYSHPRIGPILEVVAHHNINPLCDRIMDSPLESWCTPFTKFENELRAFDETANVLRKLHCPELALRVECLKSGAFMRAGHLREAETLLRCLDSAWPITQKDGDLQNAYSRLQHLKTGHKNLSMILDVDSHRARKSRASRIMRSIALRLDQLRPFVLHGVRDPVSRFSESTIPKISSR
jgi:hypothetical protein